MTSLHRSINETNYDDNGELYGTLEKIHAIQQQMLIDELSNTLRM